MGEVISNHEFERVRAEHERDRLRAELLKICRLDPGTTDQDLLVAAQSYANELGRGPDKERLESTIEEYEVLVINKENEATG